MEPDTSLRKKRGVWFFDSSARFSEIIKNCAPVNKIYPCRFPIIGKDENFKEIFLIQPKQPAVAIIGGNSSINYLIGRYTERIGCSISVLPVSTPVEKIRGIEPVAVIFASLENLENSQVLAAELTNCDIPIIVCSSMADQTRIRELGADYCLLHPFGYDNFSAILGAVMSQGSEKSRVFKSGAEA